MSARSLSRVRPEGEAPASRGKSSTGERAPRRHYEGEYDPNRLRRGAARAVRKLGEHQYRVQGHHERYYDVNLDLDTPCTCMDAYWHGRGCLHELAARLHDGDAKLILALGQMLLAAEKRKESAA